MRFPPHTRILPPFRQTAEVNMFAVDGGAAGGGMNAFEIGDEVYLFVAEEVELRLLRG